MPRTRRTDGIRPERSPNLISETAATKTIDETWIAGADAAVALVLSALAPAAVQMGAGLGRSIDPPFTDIHKSCGHRRCAVPRKAL
jgi:hypothetical protein